MAIQELGRIDFFKAPFALFGIEAKDVSEQLNIIISNVYTFLSLVGGIMFILYFVLGALSWISSGGKSEQVEKAKKMMTDAAIGLIIIAVSYPVVYIIGKVLGLDILHPEKIIPFLVPPGAPDYSGAG